MDSGSEYENLKALKYLTVRDDSINYNKYIQFNSLQQVKWWDNYVEWHEKLLKNIV